MVRGASISEGPCHQKKQVDNKTHPREGLADCARGAPRARFPMKLCAIRPWCLGEEEEPGEEQEQAHGASRIRIVCQINIMGK